MMDALLLVVAILFVLGAIAEGGLEMTPYAVALVMVAIALLVMALDAWLQRSRR